MARAPRPAPPTLPPAVPAVAALLGAASAGWALWLWQQLRVARAGGDPACGFGGDGVACTAVWDSAFASVVHASTGLPVAAWGLVWGILALAFPLLTIVSRGRRGAFPHAATLAVAAGGVGGVLVLAVAMLAGGGALCQGCVVTYGLVLAYAALVFFATGSLPRNDLGRGALGAGLAVGALWLVLLVPGLRTPKASVPILPEATRPLVGDDVTLDPAQELARFVSALPPESAQAVSDALAAWSRAEPAKARSPRGLVGSPMAPVRITDFADVLCSHCASLHQTLEELRRLTGPESFAVESRYFPLDGSCNPEMTRAGDGVRCTAARALICVAREPAFFEFAGRLYRGQRSLTEDQIYALLEPLVPRARLEACIASPDTEAKLQADIAWAVENGISGTPLVLANGRRATAFAPFLYALVLSGGDPDHPSLAALPPPRSGGG